MTSVPELPPSDEAQRLRCHWIRTTDHPDGCEPWVLIPGCTAMVTNPEGGCECDSLWDRLQRQIEHRREADQTITHMRRRSRRWAQAAAVAVEALTGKPPAGVWQPEDLESIARQTLGRRA